MSAKSVPAPIDLLDEQQRLFFNLGIATGIKNERQRIIDSLNSIYNDPCCCDTARFGDHYLSTRQHDNLIDLICKGK